MGNKLQGGAVKKEKTGEGWREYVEPKAAKEKTRGRRPHGVDFPPLFQKLSSEPHFMQDRDPTSAPHFSVRGDWYLG